MPSILAPPKDHIEVSLTLLRRNLLATSAKTDRPDLAGGNAPEYILACLLLRALAGGFDRLGDGPRR